MSHPRHLSVQVTHSHGSDAPGRSCTLRSSLSTTKTVAITINTRYVPRLSLVSMPLTTTSLAHCRRARTHISCLLNCEFAASTPCVCFDRCTYAGPIKPRYLLLSLLPTTTSAGETGHKLFSKHYRRVALLGEQSLVTTETNTTSFPHKQAFAEDTNQGRSPL